jgi:hypothetical protein
MKRDSKKIVPFLPATIFITMLFLAASCKKNGNSEGPTVKGTITLEVFAKHHSLEVPGIMVYLKAHSSEWPGRDSTLYEYKAKTDGYGRVEFNQLFTGSYYLYATGFDAAWGADVIGYIPVVLDESTVENNEASVDLMVSE